MTFLRKFAQFWYDFIVGDDWRIAAGVVVAVPGVYVGAHHHVNVWWLLPFAVAVLLSLSVGLAARQARRT
jgi:hypothetical protein